MADVRSERTLAALRAAIVELDLENPLSTVTVSDVAAKAGINRATFYSHFRSPGELLADVLRADLDQVRFRDIALRDEGTLSSEAIFWVALIRVAEHVQQFREIYCLMSIPPGTCFIASIENVRGVHRLKAWLMAGFTGAGFFARARVSN